MICNKYENSNSDNEEFKNSFDDFLKLNLVNDWDFASYTKRTITKEYRNKLDDIAKKYKLVPRAKTFVLYQTKRPILIDKRALFEIAILDSDTYSKLEIPMTSMKIRVNEYNLKYIYMFAKSFLSYKLTGEEFDFDIIKKMIKKINFIIHPHENGLYRPGKYFDNGKLNDDLIDFIHKFSKDDKIAQFLVIHIEDPFRLLYRLPEKNIPKTNKIKDFIKKELHGQQIPTWLMDTNVISKIVKSFAEEFGHKIHEIYTNNSIDKVLEFMDGMTFNRTKLEYKHLSSDNKEILKLMFEPLINDDNMDIKQLNSLDGTNNIVKFIKFLMDKY